MARYDTYLEEIAAEQQALRIGPPSAAVHRDPRILYPWLYPPPGYQEFDFPGAIALPAIGAGDTTVLQFTVPFGWDGVIRGISHNLTGGGLVPGSGAVVWRILADGKAIKNRENMLFQAGTPEQPRETFGILIYATQTVRYIVNNVALAAGGVNVICTMVGYFWPRQET